MGYYDSVKDSVKEDERGANSAKGGNFDTLKENAEENTTPDEQKGDDTPIEVVEDGGIKKEESNKDAGSSQERDREESKTKSGSGNPFTSDESGSQDLSGVEDRLDKIIDQNERMIEILESFGQ